MSPLETWTPRTATPSWSFSVSSTPTERRSAWSLTTRNTLKRQRVLSICSTEGLSKIVVASPPRLLVADDQPDVLEAVRMLARGNGFEVRTATSPAAVLALAESEELDVCLIDLNYARDTTSGTEGMDLLARLRDLDPTLPEIGR